MSTLSVPLSEEMMNGIQGLIDQGIASNKADAVRKALKKYLQDQLLETLQRASKEPRLSGDLDELAKKF